MNIIIAIIFLIAVDIVTDIPQEQTEIDNIHRRLNRIEQRLDIENINVEMTGDVEEVNKRIDEWNRMKNIPVYYDSYREYIDARVRVFDNKRIKIEDKENKR